MRRSLGVFSDASERLIHRVDLGLEIVEVREESSTVGNDAGRNCGSLTQYLTMYLILLIMCSRSSSVCTRIEFFDGSLRISYGSSGSCDRSF